jgi:hypothetical protein
LTNRLAQPLRDFARATLIDLAQDREQFGRFDLSDGA